jgi:hypothetical protein
VRRELIAMRAQNVDKLKSACSRPWSRAKFRGRPIWRPLLDTTSPCSRHVDSGARWRKELECIARARTCGVDAIDRCARLRCASSATSYHLVILASGRFEHTTVLGISLLLLKDHKSLAAPAGSQPSRRQTLQSSYHAVHMGLVSETRPLSDFGQWQVAIFHEPYSAVDPTAQDKLVNR